MRKSTLEKLRDAKRKKVEPQQMSLEDLFLLLLDGHRPKPERQALPTQRAFAYDAERIRLYLGAIGCAKTSTLCSAGWMRALLQPGSKGLVARANYNDLMDTTGLRMQEMLDRLPKGILLDRDKSPPMKWYIQPVPTLSPEGDVMDDSASTITFMGLQDGLGSYEFNWAIIDEVSEVVEQRVHEVNTRLRNQGGNYAIMMAANPTDTFHWLYKACTGKDHSGRTVGEPWVKLYTPRPKENVRNLPPGYYEQLAASLPADMRMRLIEGQWGATFEGQPVYREFSYDLHTFDNLIKKYDRHAPLHRFWDFGYRRPWCGWFQQDMQGRLLGFLEKLGENQEIGPFVRQCKAVQELHFPNHQQVHDFGDPAARQQKDTGSTLTELGKEGILLRWRIVGVDESIREGRNWLERVIDKEPAFQFDRQGMPVLINALRGGYALDGNGQKPVKDGYYDHSADGWRYGVVNLYGGGGGPNHMKNLPKTLEYDPHFDTHARGW